MIDKDIIFNAIKKDLKKDMRDNSVSKLAEKKRRIAQHSSAIKYNSNKKDFVFLILGNVHYVNFKLHGKFIDQCNQPQTTEQSLPAWLAD